MNNTNPSKTRDEFWCSWMVSSSCSTSDTRHVIVVKNQMESHEWGKGEIDYEKGNICMVICYTDIP